MDRSTACRTPPRRLAIAVAVATIAAALASGAAVPRALASGNAEPAAPRPDVAFPVQLDAWPTDLPNDPLFGPYQADLPAIGVPAAWQTTTANPGVVVAVLDTGVAATNPEFAGRLVPGYNAITGRPVAQDGWSAVADGHGHGTHVAGTAVAATDNGHGIAGIAPGARLMPIKVMPDSGPGDFRDVTEGLDWAVANGAGVVNISLSASSLGSWTAYFEQSFLAAQAAGVVVVASAGNDGITWTNYPCGFASVICVASTTKTGAAVSSFSTRSTSVEVAAPGEQIMSTLPGGTFGAWSGTSMAAPHVTGVVALMRAADPALGPSAVRSLLVATAVDMAPTGFDAASGHGRIDAATAVQAAATSASPPPGTKPPPRVGTLRPWSMATAATQATTAAPAIDARSAALDRPRPAHPAIDGVIGSGRTWISLAIGRSMALVRRPATNRAAWAEITRQRYSHR